MKARPSTTSTKPAISRCCRAETALPIAAAPAPSTTKTTVKPRMNGMLAETTLRVALRSPSRSTSTAETAAR